MKFGQWLNIKEQKCNNFGLGISCNCPECTQAQNALEKDFNGPSTDADEILQQVYAWVAQKEREGWTKEDFKKRLSTILGQ